MQYDAANLRSFYYTRGYFDADIRPATVDLTRPRTELRIDINAGPRYAVRELTLQGAAGERSIRPKKGEVLPVREVCNALLDERRQAERKGVLDFAARIEVRDLPEQSQAGKLASMYATIERGPGVITWGRIEFRGNHGISDETIRRALVLNEAEPLDQMVLRKSLARLNATGLFEPLSQANVVVNTPPGSNRADLTIQLRERKMRSWYLSGPVGPMSIAGPLQLKLGSRTARVGAARARAFDLHRLVSVDVLRQAAGTDPAGLPQQAPAAADYDPTPAARGPATALGLHHRTAVGLARNGRGLSSVAGPRLVGQRVRESADLHPRRSP